MGSFDMAFEMYAFGGSSLMEIIRLSLRVTLTAVAVGCLVGLPLGALLRLLRFPERGLLVVFLNALIGLPPVVARLVIYLTRLEGLRFAAHGAELLHGVTLTVRPHRRLLVLGPSGAAKACC